MAKNMGRLAGGLLVLLGVGSYLYFSTLVAPDRQKNFWIFPALVVAGLALAYLSSRATLSAIWTKLPTKKIRPESVVPLDTVKRLYPDFDVHEGDFVYVGSDICRVNSDGLRVNLKHWNFQQETGEFHRTVGREGKYVLFDGTSFNKRVAQYAEFKKYKRGQWIISTVIFLMVSLPLFWTSTIAATKTIAVGMLFFGGGFLAAAPLVLLCYRSKFTWSRAWGLGPEPLKLILADFGPQAITAPSDHPAQDDLTYNPTP